MREGERLQESSSEADSLRAALLDALGEEFVALVDSHPDLIELQPQHLWALVAVEDPIERMRQARAYVSQLEGLSHPSRGHQKYQMRGMQSPADALAAQSAASPPDSPGAEEAAEPARRVTADERASAQLRLRVEGWLQEAEVTLRRIDARTLDRLQTDDRSAIEDRIDRVRARLLFLVSGRRYPD